MSTRCHTYTGQGIDPFKVRPEDIRLDDIAHHLGMICRFGGATPRFYSVAQHAVHVSMMVLDLSKDPAWALHALHHDSAEAYIGDIRGPIKRKTFLDDGHYAVRLFEDVERGILAEIEGKLNLPVMSALEKASMETLIRAADLAQLQNEFAGLFGEQRRDTPPFAANPVRFSDCLPWDAAKKWFFDWHLELVDQVDRMPVH